MVTKKIVFNGLVIAILLTCNAQRAMEPEKSDDLKQLHLIHTIIVDNKKQEIKYIHLSRLSNNAIQKLGGEPTNKGHLNDVLLVSTDNITKLTSPSKAKSKIQIFDLKNKKQIYEINWDILYGHIPCLNSPLSVLKRIVKVTEVDNMPLLNIYYNNNHKNFLKLTCHYNLFSKELKKEENPIGKEIKKYTISLGYYTSYEDTKKIYHSDYIASINKDRNLYIKYGADKETIINLPSPNNMSIFYIYASPHKKSGHILINHIQKSSHWNNDNNNKVYKKIILYDNKTGKPIINFTSIIPALNKKKLRNVIFGKHEDFILFCFKKEIFLYNLKTYKLVRKYTFEENLRFLDMLGIRDYIVLSSDETEIIVTTNKTIYFLENPLAQPDIDLLERKNYLHNPEYIETNKIDICKINFSGLQDPILTLKILLLL